jgi:alkanesulfonate monooxygenase SsuD/methylene tetrahydromethanopterin reductase-like flavin-dependent oxidoreductase (luciferase family)
MMRIGAKVPNSGPLPERLGIGSMAAGLEAAGFDSLWVSDHIVLPAAIESRYPFADDGKATWPTDTPYFDALIALALIAQATERAAIGTAVLVLPLRQPVIFAKQAASIDVASGGRLRLGVGAGWLEEEFAALNVPFEHRGRRLEAWISLSRACWTGTPGPVEVMRAAAVEAGRDPASLQVVLRIVEAAGRSDELAKRLPELAAAGVDEIIVDVPLENGEAAEVHATLREAAARA